MSFCRHAEENADARIPKVDGRQEPPADLSGKIATLKKKIEKGEDRIRNVADKRTRQSLDQKTSAWRDELDQLLVAQEEPNCGLDYESYRKSIQQWWSEAQHAKLKSFYDYGMFTPIQVAAIAALDSPKSVTEEIAQVYRKRRDVLVDGLNSIGWNVKKPRASMFVWAPIPEKYKDMGSIQFSKMLIDKAEVVTSPGAAFGQYGEGYLRISMVENEQRIKQALRNIKKMMEK